MSRYLYKKLAQIGIKSVFSVVRAKRNPGRKLSAISDRNLFIKKYIGLSGSAGKLHSKDFVHVHGTTVGKLRQLGVMFGPIM